MGVLKTDAPGFVKDARGMVTNTNLSEYEMMKVVRAKARRERDLEARVAALEERLARLEGDKT